MQGYRVRMYVVTVMQSAGFELYSRVISRIWQVRPAGSRPVQGSLSAQWIKISDMPMTWR